MNKITHLLLAGAVVFALCDVGLAQETPPQPPAASPVDRGCDHRRRRRAREPPARPCPAVQTPAWARGSSRRCHGRATHRVPCSDRHSPPRREASRSMARISSPTRCSTPSFFPPPGWFVGAEVQIVKPHLSPELVGSTLPGKHVPVYENNSPIGPNATNLNIPSAPLDWTASPRVFAGYRLPVGFGEFMVAYRHLGTTGSGSVPDTTGPIGLNTRFAFDILDLDYNSRELSLLAQVGHEMDAWVASNVSVLWLTG